MIRHSLFFFLLLSWYCSVSQDVSTISSSEASGETSIFDRYFDHKTLRVDYLLAGDNQETTVYFWRMKEEPVWGGPENHLIDPWNSGNFRFSILDSATGKLLFRKGFSTLFEEYQGTPEAMMMQKAYPMTAVFPYPKKPIRFELDQRDFQTGLFTNIFALDINPSDYFILHEEITPCPVTKLIDRGDPQHHLDIVFLAEGYTAGEMTKFINDATRMSHYFLSVPPFSEMAEKISFFAVESPSVGSGIDIPGKNTYVNTGFNSSFYTFNSDRYLTTPCTWDIYDMAANAPYDQIIILVNSRQYGGGGFYNHYSESTVDHALSEIVCIHEFGHAFGGLADEYVGGVNYDGFYNLTLEPWEPNITTNVNFHVKWKQMISDTIPIPTPREPMYDEVVGLFEGGGYMASGIYSPMMNCRMNSNEANGFCLVCQRAIREKIGFYCD